MASGDKKLGHERQFSFFRKGGHNHDGENSTPVELLPGQVGLEHLNEGLVGFIESGAGSGSGDSGTGTNLVPVPDLIIETPTIGPGGSYTGQAEWANICAVRFTRVQQSFNTECTLTFYHKGTYADEDREFRARNCSDKFLWEGPWIHYDEDAQKKVYYRIENTGNQSAVFRITLKSGTMASNEDIDILQSLSVDGSRLSGDTALVSGSGIIIESDTDTNTITISATGQIEVIQRGRWALTPIKPATYTSSTTLSSNGGSVDTYMKDGYTHDTARYVTFGNGAQWIQVDIGSVMNIGAVQAVLYFGDGRVYNGVKLDLSADGVSWFTIKSSGNVWGTGEGIWAHIPAGYLARYVRLYSNGNSINVGNHLVKLIPYAISDKG